MKKCAKCNNEMFENEKICTHCGALQQNKAPNQKFVRCIGIILIIIIIYVGYIYKIEQNNNINSSKDESNEKLDNNKYDNSDETNNDQDNNIEEDEWYNTAYDTSKFINLTIDDFYKILDKKDNQKHFVLTASPYCSHCIDFVPKVNKSLEEYQYKVEYLDINKVPIEQIDKISQINGFNIFGSTPIVFVVQNGIAIDSSTGNVEYNTYIKFIEKHNVIKK